MTGDDDLARILARAFERVLRQRVGPLRVELDGRTIEASLRRRNAQRGKHRYRVLGFSEWDGSWVMACRRCGAVAYLRPWQERKP